MPGRSTNAVPIQGDAHMAEGLLTGTPADQVSGNRESSRTDRTPDITIGLAQCSIL
jgi:hypothetical protein